MTMITNIFIDGSYWIEVGCSGSSIEYYKNLGYEAEWRKRILVRVEDLKESCKETVSKVCDNCGEIKNDLKYCDILALRKKGDGKDRCDNCRYKKSIETRKINLKYKNSFEYYSITNELNFLLTEFSNCNSKKPNEVSYGTKDEYLWDCSHCKSEYSMSIQNRTIGKQDCPFCRGLRVNHTNCLWTTAPSIAKKLLNKEDGYIYTKGSGKSVDFKCERCNQIIRNKKIVDIATDGLSCPRCSDGISYPEKFMFCILEQLQINFDTQKSFSWANNKRYDFYIQSVNCIIETHGKQHYQESGRNWDNLDSIKENDQLKQELAYTNRIKHYISIDCRHSEMMYMKTSIMNSDLKLLFNIEDNFIWMKAHEFACDTLIKTACDLWNSGVTSTEDIGGKMKLNQFTISRYLKQGKSLGWCNYEANEASKYAGKKRMKPVVCLDLNSGIYVEEYLCAKDASEILNIDMASSITKVCKGKRSSACGFKWMYKEDYDKLQSMI